MDSDSCWDCHLRSEDSELALDKGGNLKSFSVPTLSEVVSASEVVRIELLLLVQDML